MTGGKFIYIPKKRIALSNIKMPDWWSKIACCQGHNEGKHVYFLWNMKNVMFLSYDHHCWFNQLNHLSKSTKICMVKHLSTLILFRKYSIGIQAEMYRRTDKFTLVWPSPLAEGGLGRGNRCVHRDPYPAVTSQTRGSHHLGRSVCLKVAKSILQIFCNMLKSHTSHARVILQPESQKNRDISNRCCTFFSLLE